MRQSSPAQTILPDALADFTAAVTRRAHQRNLLRCFGKFAEAEYAALVIRRASARPVGYSADALNQQDAIADHDICLAPT